MSRLARFPFLPIVAIFALCVGDLLPFGQTVAAAQFSTPADEEKNPVEQNDEVKVSHSSESVPPLLLIRPSVRRRVSLENVRPISTLLIASSPTAALKNGLGAFYRC
jgi:hypothetical protein